MQIDIIARYILQRIAHDVVGPLQQVGVVVAAENVIRNIVRISRIGSLPTGHILQTRERDVTPQVAHRKVILHPQAGIPRCDLIRISEVGDLDPHAVIQPYGTFGRRIYMFCHPGVERQLFALRIRHFVLVGTRHRAPQQNCHNSYYPKSFDHICFKKKLFFNTVYYHEHHHRGIGSHHAHAFVIVGRRRRHEDIYRISGRTLW